MAKPKKQQKVVWKPDGLRAVVGERVMSIFREEPWNVVGKWGWSAYDNNGDLLEDEYGLSKTAARLHAQAWIRENTP